MHNLLPNVSIPINESIYEKDPQFSNLGKRILKGSIELIDEIGFEHFTFKKLSIKIHSSEASIYRYFQSKHKLLLYLMSWYWGWMEYRLIFSVNNIKEPRERLKISIRLLTQDIEQDGNYEYINEALLHHIVIAESSKVYLVKEVDEENKEGAFLSYKSLVQRVSDIIIELNSEFKYPHMLVSTIIEGAHHQRYFAEHLPRLTDIVKGEDSIVEFYLNMAIKTIYD